MIDTDDHTIGIDEYRAAVHAAALAVAILREQPIDQILKAIDFAGAAGPILDPTLYRSKAQAMDEDRRLLGAARAFVEAVNRIGKR